MKKCIFVLLISCLVLSAAYAEEKPFITVLDFASSNIPEMEVVVFIDYLSSQIQKSGQYRVIDRMQRQNILNELEFSNSGCTDESCQLEIGKLLQAKNMIVGSMGAVGDSQILNIKLVDVETGETLNTASKLYNDMNAMIADTSGMIDELLNFNISSNSVVVDIELEDEENTIKQSQNVIPTEIKSNADEVESTPLLTMSDENNIDNDDESVAESINPIPTIVESNDEQKDANIKLWFNRTNRKLYWQNQIGGGSLFSSGMSWLLTKKLSLDFLGGISYYSYSSGSADSFDGFLAVFTPELSFYWFNNYITPFIQTGLTTVTDFNEFNLTLKGALGIQVENWYCNIGAYIPLTGSSVYDFFSFVKIAIGIKI